MEKNELTTSKKELQLSFNSLSELKAFGEEIIKSKLVPQAMKTPEDVLVAILTGRELGMQAMFSINNIYPVLGRATIGVHALSALLLSKGITIEVQHEYEPCVNFAQKDVEKSEEQKKDVWATDSKGQPIILRQGFINDIPNDYELKGKNIVNYRTVIKATRMLKQPDESFKEITAIGEFSIGEAHIAGLYKQGGNWEKYPKNMVYSRALAFVARKIAADIMAGMYETTEYMDINKIDYDINSEGGLTVEDIKYKEVK